VTYERRALPMFVVQRVTTIGSIAASKPAIRRMTEARVGRRSTSDYGYRDEGGWERTEHTPR
jgi:hypothetical protein